MAVPAHHFHTHRLLTCLEAKETVHIVCFGERPWVGLRPDEHWAHLLRIGCDGNKIPEWLSNGTWCNAEKRWACWTPP